MGTFIVDHMYVILLNRLTVCEVKLGIRVFYGQMMAMCWCEALLQIF